MNRFPGETEKTVRDTLGVKTPGALAFALVTDTHLSDTGDDTRAAMQEADAQIGYEFVIHLGDFLNGFNPPKLTERLYREETAAYAAAIRANKLFVVQGNHDGFRDETWYGQNIPDAKPNDWYHAQTRFIDAYGETTHHGDDPFYYADIAEHKLRLICMCSLDNTFLPEEKKWKTWNAVSQAQYEWFCREAVQVPDGWTVIVCSHIPPVAIHREDLDEGGLAEKHGRDCCDVLCAMINRQKAVIGGEEVDFENRDVSVAAWLFGDIHGDTQRKYKDLTLISTASQTAYIPQLWSLDYGKFPSPRTLGTPDQDCWDSVVLDRDARKLYFFRFGAGEDRIVDY
ncbi:MAG: metallophosphoesterase [Oscillospiraceae bacterium]|nr:metallophosphoesterase [Oscillospiraceae bacterium]